MIRYYKLFDLMNRRGMKKTDLLDTISAPTLAKLAKGGIVKTDIIDKICLKLECQPEDIMEVFEEKEYKDQNGKIHQVKRRLDSETDKILLMQQWEEIESYETIKRGMEKNEFKNNLAE